MKKYSVSILLLFVFLISCNNSISEKQSKENATQDSIRLDSINREQLFKALGDTVFGHVLYGMNEEQANKSIHEFWNNLPKPEKESFYSDMTFLFADIEFNKFSACNWEDIHFADLDHMGYVINQASIVWDGQLSSVVWQTRDFKKESETFINEQLNKLTAFLESKYGKPNQKKGGISALMFSPRQDGDYLIEGTYAFWETHNREVCVYVEGRYPIIEYTSKYYKYKIFVKFQNKQLMDKVRSFYNSKLEEEYENKTNKTKQDSIKTVNAL